MMKVAEELDLMDKKLSAGGAIMAYMPMLGGMQMGGMQPMGMQMGAGMQPMSPEAAQLMMAQMQGGAQMGGMQPMQPMGMHARN